MQQPKLQAMELSEVVCVEDGAILYFLYMVPDSVIFVRGEFCVVLMSTYVPVFITYVCFSGLCRSIHASSNRDERTQNNSQQRKNPRRMNLCSE